MFIVAGTLLLSACGGAAVKTVTVVTPKPGASTAPTTKTIKTAAGDDEVARVLDVGPGTGSAAKSCGGELGATEDTSCPFALAILAAIQKRYHELHAVPAHVSAVSPVTHRTYQLSCVAVEEGKLAECAAGTAGVNIPIGRVEGKPAHEPTKSEPSTSTTTCGNGIVVVAISCSSATNVAQTYINEEDEHETNSELTVSGVKFACSIDESADGRFGDITCNDAARASIEFVADAEPDGRPAPGRPRHRAPESAAQQAICPRALPPVPRRQHGRYPGIRARRLPVGALSAMLPGRSVWTGSRGTTRRSRRPLRSPRPLRGRGSRCRRRSTSSPACRTASNGIARPALQGCRQRSRRRPTPSPAQWSTPACRTRCASESRSGSRD